MDSSEMLTTILGVNVSKNGQSLRVHSIPQSHAQYNNNKKIRAIRSMEESFVVNIVIIMIPNSIIPEHVPLCLSSATTLYIVLFT